MKRSSILLMLVLGSGLVACDDPNFEQSFEIQKLRTLAMGAEPAELGPGEVAVFTSLSVDPRVAVPPTLTWELCLLTDSPDTEYQCAVFDGEEAGFELGTGPTATLPYEALDAIGVDVDELCELFGSDEIPDFVDVPDCDRGVPVTIRLTAESAGAREVSIREYVLLRPDEALRTDRNRNPMMGELSVDDVELSSLSSNEGSGSGEGSGEGSSEAPVAGDLTPVSVSQSQSEGFVALSLNVDLTEAQRYEPVDPDDNTQRLDETREVLRASWFTTHGEFEYSATYFAEDITDDEELGSNELSLLKGNAAEVGDLVRVWVVLRDDRGGISWKEWKFIFGGER